MSRTCKRCGSIDFDIWGYVGLIGYSLIVGALAYAIAGSFYYGSLVIVALVFGVILSLPMYFISIHERREEIKGMTVSPDKTFEEAHRDAVDLVSKNGKKKQV